MFEATKKLNELEKMVGNCSPTDQITDFAFQMSEQISKFSGDPVRTIDIIIKIIDNLVDSMNNYSSSLYEQIEKLNQEGANYRNAMEKLIDAKDKIRPGKSVEGLSSREVV